MPALSHPHKDVFLIHHLVNTDIRFIDIYLTVQNQLSYFTLDPPVVNSSWLPYLSNQIRVQVISEKLKKKMQPQKLRL